MAYPQGLSPHGNSWRITKRIPVDLLPHYGGKTQLRHNTGKADKREAASVAWQWLGEQEKEFDRLRTTGRREKTSIAPADLQWLVSSMLSYALGAHDEALKSGTAPAGRKSRAAIATMQEFTSWALSEGDFTGIAPVADAWLHENGYDLDEDSEDRRHVLLAFSKGLSEALRALESRHNGRWVDTPPPPERLASGTTQRVLMLSAVVRDFITKADKTKPMFKKTDATLRMFLEVIGDKPVSALRQADIDGFFALLCKLPPKWAVEQHKRGRTVPELAAMTWPKCMAPKTFEDSYMAALRPFLKDARRLYGDQDFPLNLTTDGIKYSGTRKDGEEKQRALRPGELARIFNGPECATFAADPSQEHAYWLPLVGLYTGARVNEVCQLNPQCDIREENGIWYFDITEESEAPEGVRKSVKNTTSTRRVPIHSRLLDLGFLDYVERVKADGSALLFSAWLPSRGKASGTAEKWFGKHLRALGLRDETPGARVVGFHCFRHTFLTRAHELDIAGAEALTGHTDTGTSAVVRGYQGQRGLEKLQGILEQVTFDIDPPKPAQ